MKEKDSISQKDHMISVKTFSKEPQGINKVDDRLRSIINIKNNQN